MPTNLPGLMKKTRTCNSEKGLVDIRYIEDGIMLIAQAIAGGKRNVN
jgi:hypothetical protein